jgi:SAM-dependent methyltransferase
VLREAPEPAARWSEAVNTSIAEIRRLAPDDLWLANYTKWHARRIAYDLQAIAETPRYRRARMADVGSCPYLLLAAMAKQGFNVTGIDLAPERHAAVIDGLGLDVRRCDIERESWPFDDGSLDLVIMNEVFEHLRIDLLHVFREIRRVLRPNGELHLSTPNLTSLTGLRNIVLRHRAVSCGGDLYEEWSKLERIGHMGHVREYTATELTEFLTKIGFEVRVLIWRGEYQELPSRLLALAVPSLRPFFSLIALPRG